jgi:hypothetical protein
VSLLGGLGGGGGDLLFALSLGNKGVVLGNGFLLSQSLPLLQALQVPSSLQSHRGDQSLDLGGLGVRLGTFLLGLNLSSNNELSDIVFLGQVEESSDLGGSLGTQSLGQDGVGQSGDLLFTLLDDDDGQDGNVGVDDATSNGLSLSFTGSSGSVTRVTVGEEKSGSVGEENTLLHGETLLVVTTGDPEDVSLPLVSDGVGGNLLGHPLFDEDSGPPFILEVDELLSAGGGVGDVQLHAGRS